MAKTNYNEIKVAAARTALFNNIKNIVEEINIHDVLKLSSGENLPTHKMIAGNYPVFGGGGETGLTHNIFNVDFETLAIGRVGARCGCVFKVPKKSWVTDNALYALSFDKRFLLDYLIHYLNYVDLNQYANRAAQPVISLKRISSINFPLIDEERQKAFIRIIEQVENGETHFGENYSELNNALKSVDRINELQDELSHQLTLLENLNQAILQEAVQGKLVKQDPKDEPASELLKRIKAERQKSLPAGAKRRQEKPLPPIKPEEIPFEIPSNWVWCRLGEIADSTSGGTPDRSNPNYWNGSISWLKSGELTDGLIQIESEEKITEDGFTNSSAKLFPKGTLLIALYGATAGKLGILNFESTTNQAICGFFENQFYVTKYLFYYLWAVRNKIIEDSWGQAQPNISQSYLKNLLFAFPPLSEQKRIVAEIEKQFTKTKQLKEHILANQQATDQLLKALLHKVFNFKEKEEV
jgi:type I restriction enzyme S subunit